MPGVMKKDLYLANSVAELNVMAEKLPAVTNVKLCVMSAQKVFKNAEDMSLLGDEEKAYVLYMRFFNLITSIKKTTEYKKNEKYYKDLIGMKTLLKAINEAERLSDSLKRRYEEKEAEKISKKLEILNKNKEDISTEDKAADKEKAEENGEVSSRDDKEKASSTKLEEKPSGFISPNKLYNFLKDDVVSFLILDVRTEEEFSDSHIKHTHCISVPANIVPPGITANKIEQSLPAGSKHLWKRRASVDFIILLDWTGSEDDIKPKSTLSNLKDAIFKWDMTTVIKSEPLILEGGYSDFLVSYPMLTTNAKVSRPLKNSGLGEELPSLDTIDYDLDLSFLKNPEELTKKQELFTSCNFNIEQTSDKLEEFCTSVPSVDRSKKPVLKPSTQETPHNSNMNNTNMLSSFSKLNIDHSKINNLDTMRQKLNDEQSNIPAKDTNIIRQGTVEIPKPSVNRNLKPRVSSQDQESDSSSNEFATSEASSSASSRNGSVISLDHVSAKHDYLEDNLRMKQENEKLVLEHKARLARLKKERDEMSQLQKKKAEEMREAADLNRIKKQIQEEIVELEELLAEREHMLAAEKERWVDEQMKRRDEEETRDKNNPLSQIKATLDTSKDNLPSEPDSKIKVIDGKKDENEEKPNKEPSKKQKDQVISREDTEEDERLREDRQEKMKQEQLKQERLKQDKEKSKKEMEEKERNKEEIKMGQIQQPKEKRRGMGSEDSLKSVEAEKSNLVTPGLEAGWQKLLDTNTGRYYYVNHCTQKTQWEPPQRVKATEGSPTKTFKTPLKTGAVSGVGLARSHSSPNIAKMLVDEEEQNKAVSQPVVDRGKKPSHRREVQPMLIQTEVSAAKVRNLQPIWGSMGRGLTGLRNLGNTCYMNSIIQCLSNTTPLTTYFLTNQYKFDINRENIFGKGGEVAEEYAVLIKALWYGQYKSVSPRDFKTTIGKYHEEFANYSQQDSQELLLFLMDGLHEDLNKVSRRKTLPEQDNDGIPDEEAAERAWKLHKSVNESIIVQLFQGQFKSTVRCLTCGRKSVTFDVFMYLTLPVPSSVTRSTLRDCFLNFSKEEKMTGASRWHCPQCKCPRDAVKQIVIWKLPPILLIHLKRFYYQGMWRQKITTSVDFPLVGLDMNKYLSGPNLRPTYSLYGVSNHYGSLDGGHYTAFCKNITANKWYKYDDHEVYDINARDIQSPASYILFYTCIDMPPVFR